MNILEILTIFKLRTNPEFDYNFEYQPLISNSNGGNIISLICQNQNEGANCTTTDDDFQRFLEDKEFRSKILTFFQTFYKNKDEESGISQKVVFKTQFELITSYFYYKNIEKDQNFPKIIVAFIQIELFSFKDFFFKLGKLNLESAYLMYESIVNTYSNYDFNNWCISTMSIDQAYDIFNVKSTEQTLFLDALKLNLIKKKRWIYSRDLRNKDEEFKDICFKNQGDIILIGVYNKTTKKYSISFLPPINFITENQKFSIYATCDLIDYYPFKIEQFLNYYKLLVRNMPTFIQYLKNSIQSQFEQRPNSILWQISEIIKMHIQIYLENNRRN